MNYKEEYNKINFELVENQELFREVRSILGFGYNDDFNYYGDDENRPLTDKEILLLKKEVVKKHEKEILNKIEIKEILQSMKEDLKSFEIKLNEYDFNDFERLKKLRFKFINEYNKILLRGLK